MKISDIVNVLKNNDLVICYDDCLVNIDYVSYNSKDIKENTLFICKGNHFKEDYLKNAVSLGAVCYVSEVEYSTNIPKIIVTDVRKSLSLIAELFYTDNLFKIGITGTKGKTTVNYFINNILTNYLGYKPGIIASHYLYTGKREGSHELTTPESLDLHKYFKEMSDCNLKYVSMEVSSQAIKHSRVYNMNFDIGIFLNISEDHISTLEHKDFEDYFSCKLEFLKMCDKVIVFKGTDHLDRVMEAVCDKDVITFGFSDADYIIKNISNGSNISFELFDGVNTEIYEINMLGEFNVVNAASAIIVGKIIGASYKDICKGLINTSISGRMNIINKGVCPIIIDYAHNRLSAEAFYKALKDNFPNRKIKVIFGCPGDKGFNRRKEMGELAGMYADYVYLTEEDPGHASVREICNEIAFYITKYHSNYEIIENRYKAIAKALRDATSDDVIALLGKGDENYQIIGDTFVPYETDKEIVLKELSKIKGVKE